MTASFKKHSNLAKPVSHHASSSVAKVDKPKLKLKRNVSVSKPKRPLSAYNFFYKIERAKLLGLSVEDELNAERSGVNSRKRKRARKHRKTPGMIGFTELAKKVSAKWRSMSDEEKAVYEKMFEEDRDRYQREMEAWAAKKEEQERKEHKALQRNQCAGIDISHPMTSTAPAEEPIGSRIVSPCSSFSHPPDGLSQIPSAISHRQNQTEPIVAHGISSQGSAFKVIQHAQRNISSVQMANSLPSIRASTFTPQMASSLMNRGQFSTSRNGAQDSLPLIATPGLVPTPAPTPTPVPNPNCFMVESIPVGTSVQSTAQTEVPSNSGVVSVTNFSTPNAIPETQSVTIPDFPVVNVAGNQEPLENFAINEIQESAAEDTKLSSVKQRRKMHHRTYSAPGWNRDKSSLHRRTTSEISDPNAPCWDFLMNEINEVLSFDSPSMEREGSVETSKIAPFKTSNSFAKSSLNTASSRSLLNTTMSNTTEEGTVDDAGGPNTAGGKESGSVKQDDGGELLFVKMIDDKGLEDLAK